MVASSHQPAKKPHRSKYTMPAKKTATKPQATTATPTTTQTTTPAEKLTGKEIKVLQKLLAADGESVGRKTLKEECGAGSKVLGAATKAGFGEQGGGLQGRGLIKGQRNTEESKEIQYIITKEGKKALAAALKADDKAAKGSPKKAAASK